MGDFGIKIAEAKNVERKMVNLKILNKINMLQLDKIVDGLAIIVERLNGIQNLTDGHETMPAFLHQPVPSFDGENGLNSCPKNWMVVQFSADWMEAKIILLDGMMKGGGARAMRRLTVA